MGVVIGIVKKYSHVVVYAYMVSSIRANDYQRTKSERPEAI
jgi:hypothetical protein